MKLPKTLRCLPKKRATESQNKQCAFLLDGDGHVFVPTYRDWTPRPEACVALAVDTDNVKIVTCSRYASMITSQAVQQHVHHRHSFQRNKYSTKKAFPLNNLVHQLIDVNGLYSVHVQT